MTSRLPSKTALTDMYFRDRHTILDLHAREIREEIEGVKSGYITLTNGLKRAHVLANAARRLKHVCGIAGEFGLAV